MLSENGTQCLMEQMCCGMQGCGKIAVIGKTAFELLFSSRTRNFLMFLKCCVESFDIDAESVFLGKLLGQLYRESECVV